MNPEPNIRYASEKDPETLEREINQTRAEMNETLDSLERKLTAGQLLDQCLKFFGMKGTEIGSSVGKCLKDNPMPFFLTATGIGWMMFGPSQSGSARGERGSYADSDNYERYDGNERGITDRAGEAISGGIKLARVYPDHAIVLRDGVEETLTLTRDSDIKI